MKVLIIDDDNFIRTIYSSEFRQENIEVEVAVNGEDGLQKAAEGKPDVILLDMMLPVLDGFEVLRRLQSDETLRGIPVIVFSGLNQESDVNEALQMGAHKYLPKGRYSIKEIVDQAKELGKGF